MTWDLSKSKATAWPTIWWEGNCPRKSAAAAASSAAHTLQPRLGGGTSQRPNDGFEIEQFAPGTGRLVAEANAGVYLTETSGAVNVLNVQTPTGDVALIEATGEITPAEWTAILLSLRVAVIATLVALPASGGNTPGRP